MKILFDNGVPKPIARRLTSHKVLPTLGRSVGIRWETES
jgi:hypothetical protein